MADDLARQRRFFAEEIQAVGNLKTPALVEALASVPREAFLPPGPWTIRAESDIGAPPRHTPDADPRHVYHNVSVAIDPSRMLFNGAPGLVAVCVDALALRQGDRVLHVGCGPGYYSAVMARVVGPAGRVRAVEVDAALAERARECLAGVPSVDVTCGNGVEGLAGEYDAILVNAGMTHPHEAWLHALAPGGRFVLPLTFTMPQMGPIGKGIIVLITRAGEGDALAARPLVPTAIYSAVGIRDEAYNDRLLDAMKRGIWPAITRLRRDPHDQSSPCWLHGDTFCLSG
jgi:protein-L-isoaspartate(D-aspartate) O-methyltransferase